MRASQADGWQGEVFELLAPCWVRYKLVLRHTHAKNRSMFSLPSSEKVVPLADFPQSSIGAPCPAVIATEHSLILIFFLEDRYPDWDGTTVRMVSIDSTEEQCAVIHFDGPSVHTLGPPNDEALSGHRLVKKGLQPYGAFEVIHSEWIQTTLHHYLSRLLI
jgi:hypothetical protein